MHASDEALDQDTFVTSHWSTVLCEQTLDLRDIETCQVVSNRVNIQVTGVAMTSSIRIHLPNGRLWAPLGRRGMDALKRYKTQ